VALVRGLVGVDLEDQEDARVLPVAARLVVQAAGLRAGGLDQGSQRLEHGVLLAFLGGPLRGQDKGTRSPWSCVGIGESCPILCDDRPGLRWRRWRASSGTRTRTS